MRHALRQLVQLIFGGTKPRAGTGLLTCLVTLASALWVSVSMPNLPLLRGLDDRTGTSVAISLQSALLGIDDRSGHTSDAHALAHALGLSDDVAKLLSHGRLNPRASSRGVRVAFTPISAELDPLVAVGLVPAALPPDPQPLGPGSAVRAPGSASDGTPPPVASPAPSEPKETPKNTPPDSAPAAPVAHPTRPKGGATPTPQAPSTAPAPPTKVPVADPGPGGGSQAAAEDTRAPAIQVHADLVVEAAGPGGANVSYTPPPATDAVDGLIAAACAPASGHAFHLGHTTVSCTAVNTAHNFARSSFDVLVHDTTAPTMQAHADLVAEASGPGGANVSYTAPRASDAVDGSVPVACAPASGSLFALGHTTVSCTATDAAHNTTHSSFDVLVDDTTGPVIPAHADHVVEAAGPAGTTVSYVTPTATDALDGPVPVSCAPASGSTFALGQTVVSCGATDAANNITHSSFDVLVVDTTGPVIQAHPDLVAAAAGPAGASVSYTAPSATDAVDGAVSVACAPASGSIFALGHIPVSCTATDAAQNVTHSSFDVLVADTTGPVIQTHVDLAVDATGPGGASVSYAAPSASDAVDGPVSVVCAAASGSTFALGHTTVSCTATDAANNTTHSSFDVLVDDTTGPAIQVHADLVVDATGPAGASVSYTAPSASDVVDGPVSVVCAPASGSTFALGHTIVSCTATDAAQNVTHSSFDVLVADTTGPVIQTHANVVAEAAGPAGALVTYTAPAASDAVDGSVSAVCAPASGSTFALGHTTVSCTATDAANNIAHSSFDVLVVDTTGPVIQAHADLVVDATGPAGASVSYTAPSASDAVDGPVSVVCAPASGSTFALGHTVVSCTTTDAANNASHSSFDVLVGDLTGPVIQAHAGIVVEAGGPGGATVTYTAPTATDLLDGPVPVSCAPASGSMFALGHTTVTCSAHDAAGNAAAPQTFDVHVRDTTAPTLQVHADVVAEATGSGGATVNYTAPAASDSVDTSVTVTCAPASGTVFAFGHTTVTCSAHDASGNAAPSTTFDVQVRDTTGPAIQAHADVVAEATGPGGAIVSYAVPTASDAVDGAVSVTCAPASGTTFALGHTTVTCTAQDARSNVSHSAFDVNVHDTTAPVIQVPVGMTVQAPSNAGIAVSYTATATDTVDGTDTVTCSPASGTTFPIGHTTVTCTAQDAAGNQATSQTFDVYVTATPSYYDDVQSLFSVAQVIQGFGLSHSVENALYDGLIATANAVFNGDAVGTCQAFNGFTATAQTKLTAGQFSTLTPSIDAARTTLGC